MLLGTAESSQSVEIYFDNDDPGIDVNALAVETEKGIYGKFRKRVNCEVEMTSRKKIIPQFIGFRG